MLFSKCDGDQVKKSDLGNFSALYSKLWGAVPSQSLSIRGCGDLNEKCPPHSPYYMSEHLLPYKQHCIGRL